MEIQENVILKPFSTFKIGGSAQYFAKITSTEDLVDALRFAQEKDLPVGIIGAGCNLIITDEGIPGLVIKMENQGIAFDSQVVRAEAGLSFAAFTARAHQQGLTGVEWMPSVPSSIGGGIRGNAGAFGGETKDLLKAVQVYRNDRVEEIDVTDLDFQYRYSTFKAKDNTDVILGGVFELQAGSVDDARGEVRGFIQKKQANQPTGVACSGCIFQNYEGQIVDENLVSEFPELAVFNEKSLIPTGYLIERAGLKGTKVGGVQVSEKHANYIINPGNDARYQDVLDMIAKIKATVKDRFGVDIKEEAVYLHHQMKKR